MTRASLCAMVVHILLLTGGIVRADIFEGDSASGELTRWIRNDNWDSGSYPDAAGDDAIIGTLALNNMTAELDETNPPFDDNILLRTLTVGNGFNSGGSVSGQLNVTQGTITARQFIIVGNEGGSGGGTATGTVVIDGGTLIQNGAANAANDSFRIGSLSGATGHVTITAGSLQVADLLDVGFASGASFATGTLTVSGGDLDLGTSGTADGANQAVGIAIGRNSTGTFNLTGDSATIDTDLLQFGGGSAAQSTPAWNLTIESPTSVTTINADFLNIAAAGDTAFDVTLAGGGYAVGNSWDLISYTTSSNANMFDVGTSFTNSQGIKFSLDYGDLSNDTVTLTITSIPTAPEPSAFVLAIFASLGLAFGRFGRRRTRS